MVKHIQRPERGRGLLYNRDSGGKAEMAPGAYVQWGIKKSKEMGLRFDGTVEAIESLIKNGGCEAGDIYFDYCKKGNMLSRPALDALKRRIATDPEVTHIFIPRRDRLARPDNPNEGIELELALRKQNVSLVFMDSVAKGLRFGERVGIGEFVMAAIAYDSSGNYLPELAQKIIHAHIELARAGFSTGGRPCYGFRRYLVKTDGTTVRELQEGERVKMAGHHVVWLPVSMNAPEMKVIMRIRRELLKKTATQIARELTRDGIPPPDFGRERTDNGIKHKTLGIWNSTTVTNIGRNPLLAAITTYGLRSMGDHLRYSADGPRELTPDDVRDGVFHADGRAKVKVIRNPKDSICHAQASFSPIVPLCEHENLQKVLDQRAGGNLGKHRSRSPERNPLYGRVFDFECAWPMYRAPYKDGFRYVCGSYLQSHGEQCDYNHVDGLQATLYALGCLRGACNSRARQKLKQRMLEIAKTGDDQAPNENRLQKKLAELEKTSADLKTASRNLALVADPTHLQRVGEVVTELSRREQELTQEVEELKLAPKRGDRIEQEVAAALDVVNRLSEITANQETFAEINQAFASVNLNMFFRFQKKNWGKRQVNVLSGGVVTFGNHPPPVEKYAGPTNRKWVKVSNAAQLAAKPEGGVPLREDLLSGGEGDSLRKRSRDDKI